MPSGGIAQFNHADVLTYEEITRVVRSAVGLGINRVRLTGGEPLVRLGISRLVAKLHAIPGITDLAMTTNGLLLGGQAAILKSAGLRRVNVSLDSLQPARFASITGGGRLEDTLAGIRAAQAAGLTPVKVNMVVMDGVNVDEVADLARLTLEEGWHVRFIELMPFALEAPGRFLSVKEIKKLIDPLGHMEAIPALEGCGPARYYRLPGAAGTIGFISPVSDHFCFSCNRLRLTADGQLRACLLSDEGLDLRPALRGGVSDAGLEDLIKEAVRRKPRRHQLAAGALPHTPMKQVGG
jgi:cyclic pyranopterin phosphate synthase